MLRRKVASYASKLAFYRLIGACNVSHRKVILKPFTNPDQPDISIAGSRIEWINFLISRPKSIKHIIQNPESLLKFPMIVDLSRADRELMQDEDILFFSIALGKTTAHLSELRRYIKPDEEKYLCYPLPLSWAHPEHYESLGKLTMKSECDPEMIVELGGVDNRRVFSSFTQVLPAKVRIEIDHKFYSLSYVHVLDLPVGRISIYSPKLGQTCTIYAHEWGNLWVYGVKIMLIGYISWKEFNHRSYELPAGSLVLGELRLPVKTRAIDVAYLHPICELIPNIPYSIIDID